MSSPRSRRRSGQVEPRLGPLRIGDARHDLLLMEERVFACSVERRYRRRVRVATSVIDAEVVADEASGRANAARVWRRELRIPRVSRETDVLPDRREVRAVELDG